MAAARCGGYCCKRDYEQIVTHGIWHVSEGWDGVGVLMYRALLADLLSRVHTEYLVVPVGQGNLFLGAHLGREDARANDTQLVGAIPFGENIFDPLDEDADKRELAIAPKLAGRNTPLAECLRYLAGSDSVYFVRVCAGMQRAVAARQVRQQIAMEPSSLIAFAALRGDEGGPPTA